MNYGLYLSAGGALASMFRQDVTANNLANINTVGFKPETIALQSRLPARLEANHPLADPQVLLEQLGGGAFISPVRINMTQGAIADSANDLDLALDGEGFFVINSGRGDSPAQQLRFTRDGRFTLNNKNELIMSGTGMSVLDVNDQPIHLKPGLPVQIDGDGNIKQNGVIVATLQIRAVADKVSLSKEGDSLLRFGNGQSDSRIAAAAMVRQRAVEMSAVDPILSLNAMINASKAVGANATMMQYHDHLLGQVVNTFGRVA